MVTYTSFISLDGTHQLDVLGDAGIFLAEKGRGGAYSLYYLVGAFFVEIRIDQKPAAHITLHSFTSDDPQFEELVEALPVDLSRLLDPSR